MPPHTKRLSTTVRRKLLPVVTQLNDIPTSTHEGKSTWRVSGCFPLVSVQTSKLRFGQKPVEKNRSILKTAGTEDGLFSSGHNFLYALAKKNTLYKTK